MPLHLVKLAVGVTSLNDMKQRVAAHARLSVLSGEGDRHVHVTRMVPKRDEELTDGGSLYWVIRGEIIARQEITAIEAFRDGEGVGRCRIIMTPVLHAVSPRKMRPFQGWRYLSDDDKPADLGSAAASIEAMPEAMRRELRDLGLL